MLIVIQTTASINPERFRNKTGRFKNKT